MCDANEFKFFEEKVMSMTLCSLWVIDKYSRKIHKIGEGWHDSLSSDVHGEVHYVNMQNGDGGGVRDEAGYGYVILMSDSGSLLVEFGIIDKRFVSEIKDYLKELGEDVSRLDDNGNYIRLADDDSDE